MKLFNKILYYISVAGSAGILFLFLLGPFGGFHVIEDFVREGLYSNFADVGEHILFYRIRQFLVILFWLTLFVCVALPFTKFDAGRKHRIGLICLIILTVLILFPSLIDIV